MCSLPQNYNFNKKIMSEQFFPKLSQNYIEILEDNEYYDITIEVGSDPYVKIFRAHMIILNYRSPYLRRILSTSKRGNDETLTHIKLPNISYQETIYIHALLYKAINELNIFFFTLHFFK